jgi:hypothetical protein
MPYARPGIISYHVATKTVTHGNPVVEDNMAGIAIKQQEQSWTLGIANRNVIAIGESFAIMHKGQTQIAAALLTAPAKGDPVYITIADNTLSKVTAAGKLPFGRVTNLAGDNRGTPTGFIRIDMDARDSVPF